MALQVELVAADRQVWAGEATMVSARSVDGDMGILPGHTPTLVVLTAGDVRIHKSDLLGKLNNGWNQLMTNLEKERFAIAAQSIGCAQNALDCAVQYAKDRIQFGKPIGSFQAIQHKCADMLIEVEVGRNLAYRAAAFEDTADLHHAAAYAKSYLGDAATRVTRAAIQVHGGVGFVDNHRVQPFYRLALTYNSLYGTAHDHRREVTALALGEEVA